MPRVLILLSVVLPLLLKVLKPRLVLAVLLLELLRSSSTFSLSTVNKLVGSTFFFSLLFAFDIFIVIRQKTAMRTTEVIAAVTATMMVRVWISERSFVLWMVMRLCRKSLQWRWQSSNCDPSSHRAMQDLQLSSKVSQYVVGSVLTLFPSLPATHWDLTRLLDPPLPNIATRLLVTRLFLTVLLRPPLVNIVTSPNSFTAITFALKD